MNFVKKYPQSVTLAVLFGLNVLIWVAVSEASPRNFVTVSFLDIGQGDSELIQGRNGNTVLVDGGPNRIVLRRLTENLPTIAKSIDMLVETHPDSDHIGGFPSVLNTYKVGSFMEPGVESPNNVDDEIRKIRGMKHVPDVLARAGMILDFHDGSFLRVLFPDRDPTGWETNTASIVMQYVYGDTCFLLTGDSPSNIEDYLVTLYGHNLKCDVLKAGHHGSKYSTDDNYLNFVMPTTAIISAGFQNKYGHPSPETITRLQDHNVQILSTIDLGTIIAKSDGKTITFTTQKKSTP